MTLLAHGTAESRDGLDADALIEEARQRHRRRRHVVLSAFVLFGLVAGGGYLLAASGTPPSGQALHHVVGASRFTVVDAAAMKGHGDLAFVSLGDLFVLDGATGKVMNVSGPNASAGEPSYSANGQWLVYDTGGGQTWWLARGDGTASKRLNGTAHWLPNGELAVSSASGAATYAVNAAEVLRRTGGSLQASAVRAGGTTAYLIGTDTLKVNPPRSSRGVMQVETTRSPHGPRTLWYSAKVYFTAAGGLQGTFVGAVAALPGNRGLLLTIEKYCCDYADGVQLYELRTPGGQPKLIDAVLRGSLMPSFGPNGTFALAAGGNRYAWVNKHVEMCNEASARCSVLPTPKGVLSLSPAWSPDTRTLAVIEASSEADGAIGQSEILQWYATHHLFLLSRGEKSPIEVPDTRGAMAPLWSADSKSLMFVKNDALYLIAKTGARPVEVAGPLFTPTSWSGYYGEINWGAQFAWSAS